MGTMKKVFAFIAAMAFTVLAMGQTVELTFTGRDTTNHPVQLSRIFVTNLTQGWQEILFWPDTVLTLQNSNGIDDMETCRSASLQLSQNTPNPFSGTTDVFLTIPNAGAVTLEITDINGRVAIPLTDVSTMVQTNDISLEHQFRVTLSTEGTYVMTARQNGKSSSIKMMNLGGGAKDAIEYTGNTRTNVVSPRQILSSATHPFNIGDQMEYKGYAIINNTQCESFIQLEELSDSEEIAIIFETSSQDNRPTVSTDPVTMVYAYDATMGGTIIDNGGYDIIVKGVSFSTQPDFSGNATNIIIQSGTEHFEKNINSLSAGTTYYVRAFATNSVGTSFGNIQSFTTQTINGNRCTGIPTVTDIDGNVYTTEQIGEQCWMKENLRTTHTSQGIPIPAFDDPNQDVNMSIQYGRLYPWVVAMNGENYSDSIPSGVQGICPDGWHIPSDAEWKKLEIFAGMDPVIAQDSGYRSNIAVKLCDSIGWAFSDTFGAAGNMNAPFRNETGFSALAAGDGIAFFSEVAVFWTSSTFETNGSGAWPWYRAIIYNGSCIIRDIVQPNREYFSVRCLKD